MQEQIEQENFIISQALSILSKRVSKEKHLLSSPTMVKNYLTLKLGQLEHEVFGIMWLDSKNKLIKFQEMFRGTLNSCSVYPREVIKEGLKINACSAILYHNHPSGDTIPSKCDILLTSTLYKSLQLVGINILDHLIVAGDKMVAFSEKTYMTDITEGRL